MKRWKMIVPAVLVAGCVMSAAVYAEETMSYENSGIVETDLSGKTLDFLSTDLDGNTVIGKQLYAGNTITMVVLWGTWSPECMEELPKVAQVYERLQEKGCGVVGLDYETDLEGDEAMEAAKTALEECGAGFPNAVMPTKLDEKVSGYPTAFFVNSDGIVLTAPLTGAVGDSCEGTINALLDGTITPAAEIEFQQATLDAAKSADDAGNVAGDAGDGSTAAGISGDGSSVAGVSGDGSSAAGVSGDGSSVAGDAGDSSSVAGDSDAVFELPDGAGNVGNMLEDAGIGTVMPGDAANAYGAAQSEGEDVKTMIVARNANMRDAPHGNFMRVIPSGTTVKVLGTAGDNNDWYQIEIYGIVGYLYQDLLTE